MISDLNKNMTINQYNYLNLLQQLNINTDGTNGINYLYDAADIKLRKQTRIDYAVKKTLDYIGSFVYEDNELRYILTNEGRVMANSDGTYEYQYFLKDHLGNTRVVFTSPVKGTVEILQESHYYPFGMEFMGVGGEQMDITNYYKYNGKELQDDGFDLDENGIYESRLLWYDYGARFYDAQLGRWHVPDPMFDKHYDWSPYAYVLNNPLGNIDLYGFTDWKAIWQGSAMVVGGLASTIGGVAAALTPTGVGQIGGAFLISTGVPTMGVGIGKIVSGILDNGTAEKIPGGPLETGGMIGDALLGNENNELRKTGSVLDIGVNLATGGTKTAIEQVALGVQVITTADDIINTDNNNSQTNTSTTTNSDNNTSATITRDNTNVVNNLPEIKIDINSIQVEEMNIKEILIN